MSSGSDSALHTGEVVTVVGLAIQLLFFSFFIIVSFVFHRRYKTSTDAAAMKISAKEMFRHRNWETVLYVLYAASALILVRSVFRIIEFAMGNDGPLLSTEVYAYLFDATLMFVVMAIFNVFHPSSVLGAKGDRGSAIGLTSRGSAV
jgi:hypothetical protein